MPEVLGLRVCVCISLKCCVCPYVCVSCMKCFGVCVRAYMCVYVCECILMFITLGRSVEILIPPGEVHIHTLT